MSLKNRIVGLLTALFGRLSWERPAWLTRPSGAPEGPSLAARLGGFARRHARALLALLAVGAAGGGIYAWVVTRPPPPEQIQLLATVSAPQAPLRRLRSDPVPPPIPLFVNFDGSAAPLDQINKVVTAHVALHPALAGEWKWVTERSLTFTPAAPWPIGEKYRVSFDPQLVARPNVVLLTSELGFETPAFQVTGPSLEFYQDPVDPSVKQVVGTFRFNYPVEASSFEKLLELTSAPGSNSTQKATHRFSVTYDDLRYEAYVRSESLPLPAEDHFATLVLQAGARAEGTTRGLERSLNGTVIVPGRGNKFKVQHAQLAVVPGAEGNPDQVLVFSCTSDVSEKRFAAAVKAWVLPKDRPAMNGQPAVPNYPWGEEEVGPEVLRRATPLKLEPIPGEREVGAQHSFRLDAKPGARLFVRVEAGVEAYGGYVLLKPYEMVGVVPEYPRELRLAHEGAVLSVSGDKKLTVTSRGIPGFRVRLFRIQPKDLNHLITQSSGDFAHLRLRGGTFNEENISEVFTEVQRLDASNPRIAQYAAVDFTPHLKEGGEQRGLYFVRVEAWDPVHNRAITQGAPIDESPADEPSEDAEEAPEAVDRDDFGSEGGEGEYGEGYDEGYGEGEGEYAEGWGQISDRRFILLTDLGVIEKVDAQQNHWVFVQSFQTGNPVGGAQVEVLAKNGTVVVRKATDGSGAATLPPLTDFTAEKTPVALVVRRDGDVSFLPLNRSDRRLDLSRFDVGGVRTRGRAAALTAYAFTDRGLYRPGETAHLATIVRAVDWSKSMKGLPLQLTVTDPRGLQVRRQRVALDATGLTAIDFTPEERAPTGTYTFTVAVAAEKDRAEVHLGSTTFRVEEFLPDRMRMTTRFDAPAVGWVTASSLDAVVELSNLFGTPAADHQVKASFTLAPYTPSFSKYPGYDFFDPARAKRTEAQDLGEAQTDGEGRARYSLDLSSWAPATWQVSFYAEGFELGGGRSVSSATSVVVSPRQFLLGSKADGDLGFVKRGVERRVDVIAIAPSLEKVAVENLQVLLVEQRYVSTLTREQNGSFRYQSVLKDVTRKTDALSLPKGEAKLTLPSAEVGSFFLSVRDAEDVELLRVPYTVAGEANVAKDLERNAELKVSLDKPEYEPGDTISVQITAPYAGTGVITIERDRVFVHKPFRTTTSTTVQTIEVPASGLEANGYVQVAFVRALDSPELYVSPLSYGVVPFKVLKRSQHLELKVSADALTRPGRPLAIRYRTDQPAKVVLFAVDEGILQVARYETPDPLGFFLARRALEVSTRQIVDLLLPEYRLVHATGKEGGDEDAANVARNLNPFKRKADRPAVFWSGVVDAGPEERSVTFVVPESFNGSLRVMAVAASPEALAATRTTTTVRGPFVIAPNTPTFVSPGDRFAVTAAIANNVEGSGDKAQVTVTLTPNASFTVQGSTTQTLTIPERREAVASFEVTATEVLGAGELQFLASGSKQEASRTAHLSVRPASAYLTSTRAGTVKDTTVELAVQRRLFNQLSTRELRVSLLPLGLGAGAVDYLESYPHFCSEQLSSRAAPALVFMKRPEWGYDAAQAKLAVERAFNVLRARQNENGQFGYWAANSFTSDPLDVYITLMLTEARERGVAVPVEVRQRAIAALKRLVAPPVADLPAARTHAQALYVLARNDIVMPAPTAQVAEWLGRQDASAASDVAYVWLAGVYKLTNNAQRAQQLVERFTLSDRATQPTRDVAFYFDEHTYRAQVMYVVARHFPARLDAVGPKLLGLLVESMVRGQHSLSAAWSLYALDAYATAVAGTGQGGLTHVTVEVKDRAGQWKPQALGGPLTGKVAFTETAAALRLVAKDGPMVFYSLTEGGFDRDPPKEAIKEGLELIHSLEDGQGKEVSRVALGDEVVMRLRTRSLRPEGLRNLAIVDLLPSGFEVVLSRGTDQQGLDRLVGAGASWRPEELDAREDRVIFYGSATQSVAELTYRLKAVARGTFVLPPSQGTGMYDPTVRARSTSGTVVVE